MRVPASPLIACVLLQIVLLSTPLRAQQQVEGATPPYDADMQHLAEVLGALHYLRPLCGAKEDTRWRDEMRALIEAEAPAEPRRGQFVASFNRGYGSYAEVYRSCTPSARLAASRYLQEGAKLARDIATRYGSN